MRDRSVDDPTIPPPGKRTGSGSGSVMPYLERSLAARPSAAGEIGRGRDDTASERRATDDLDLRTD